MKINCKNCWKEIEKKWPREYCIKCRKLKDREIQAEYREKRKLLNSNKSTDD